MFDYIYIDEKRLIKRECNIILFYRNNCERERMKTFLELLINPFIRNVNAFDTKL